MYKGYLLRTGQIEAVRQLNGVLDGSIIEVLIFGQLMNCMVSERPPIG